ncbi:MAG: hypothetical protein ACERKZ_12920 [Lachnotalea sp.]
MKTGIYSNLLTCENKEKFNVAKSMGFNGVILDFNENNLSKLPTRNYYVFQSIKTELAIPAVSVNQFKTVNMIQTKSLLETKNTLLQYIDIAEKMKVNMLILPFIGASQITTDTDLENVIELLLAICPFGEENEVQIGILEDINNELKEKLLSSINSTNLFFVTDGFGEWNIIDSETQLAQEQ